MPRRFRLRICRQPSVIEVYDTQTRQYTVGPALHLVRDELDYQENLAEIRSCKKRPGLLSYVRGLLSPLLSKKEQSCKR